MNILEIISKKRDKQELSKQELEFFVEQYVKGNITDYQAAALVMAIYLNGMAKQEIADLALAMAYSGEVLDLSPIGEVVDKHSTGGVGDKVTLILMPIIASLGIPVAKMSGRGLGFTGGTIDKLESIPGYNTNMEWKEFIQNVKEIGISLMGQTLDLAPADKKLYALRDSISCVENIPLIASSIMSKKIAAGAKKIVLDVTCGDGAFMKDLKTAKELAITMKEIGELANKETICVITNMEEPLGKYIGNTLEVIEAVQFLQGNMQDDVKEVVFELGAYMIQLAGKGENREENKKKILEVIQNKKAFEKFIQLVERQGGDSSYIKDTTKFKKASYCLAVSAKRDGYIQTIRAGKIGELSAYLGAGRIKKEDYIDPVVGIELEKKVGSKVEKGEILAYIHTNDEEKGKKACEDLAQIIEIGDLEVARKKNVLEIII